MNHLRAFRALIIAMWHQLQCECYGHQLVHRQRISYRDHLNYCARCEAPIHIRALAGGGGDDD